MQENAPCKVPAIVGTKPKLFVFKWEFLTKTLRIMKLTAVFLLAAVLQVSAKGFGQEKITLALNNAPLEQVFGKIEKQTGYLFIYRTEMVADKKVTIHVANATLKETLDRCFKDQKLTYNVVGKSIVISSAEKEKNSFSYQQTSNFPPLIDIHGRVVNEKGDAVADVTVTVKGTTKSTITDKNGEFSLSTVEQDAVLVFTHVSMETFELKVSGKTDLVINLKTKVSSLGGVEILANTGYQMVKPNEINGSLVVVDNKLLNEQTGTNILDRLNGVTSSLLFNIGKVNNNPQSNTGISIRGLSTINGPLDPLIVLDNFIYEGNINNINPNDVENITVLKDAAAASIWGARAGNGVIVITTKKGKFNQKLKVELNSDLIISEKPDLYYLPQMSSSDYVYVEQYLFNKGFFNSTINNTSVRAPITPAVEILLNRRNGLISSADSAKQIDALKAVDVRDQYNKYFYQNATTQQYALNMRGGSGNMAWLISGAYDKSVGTLKTNFNKANLRVENSFKPLKFLTLNFSTYYTNSKSLVSGAPAYNSITINGRVPTYLQFADDNGDAVAVNNLLRAGYTDTAGGGKLLNWKYYPLDDYKHDKTTVDLQEIVANIGANIEITKALQLTLNYQYQKQWSLRERNADIESFYTRNLINKFTNLSSNIPATRNPIPLGGILDDLNSYINSQNFRGQANYSNKWNDHAISGLIGTEIRQVEGGGNDNTYFGYNNDPLTYTPIDLANAYPTYINKSYQYIPGSAAISSTSLNRFVSIFSNFSYTFRERYNLSASFRKDAANLFGVNTNDKWKPLWSAGLGWELSRERFFSVSWIDYLKLRTSYGYSGNVDLRKTALPIASYNASALYTTFPFATITSLNDPELRWEKVGQLNFGLDFSALKGIISGSLDYYIKKGSDLYGESKYDYTAWGRTDVITKNVAAMQSKGVDVIIKSKNIDKTFKWNTHFLFNYSSSKTTKYFGTNANNIIALGGGRSIVPVVGKPLYGIAAYKWGGLDSIGDPRGFLNGQLSKDYASIMTQATTKGLESGAFGYIGPATPTVFGSLINEFNWKGFSLAASIIYKFGYYFVKPTLSYYQLLNGGIGNKDFAKRWQSPGDEKITNVPALVYTNYKQFFNRDAFYLNSDINVLKADNIRLQYINLSYTYHINRKSQSLINSIQLYANAANLGIIWRANKENIDPDYPNSLPLTKTYTVGLRASF
jgi:TonB-linked SusC/RagA family outer membrane protein